MTLSSSSQIETGRPDRLAELAKEYVAAEK